MKMEIDDESVSPSIPLHSDLMSCPGSIKFLQSNRLPKKFVGGEKDGIGSTLDLSPDRPVRQFSRQYAHTYFIRLCSMRPLLETKIRQSWPSIPLKRIAGLCESSTLSGSGGGGMSSPKKIHNSPKKYSVSLSPRKSATSTGEDEQHGQHIALREDVTVAIIGTAFKQQPDKPSILRELVEEIQLTDRTIKENYISEKDVLLLEDETTRVRLIPTPKCGITIDGLVNGIVFGVKGRPTIDGRFEVEDVVWATPSPAAWPDLKYSEQVEMVFVSGLQFGSETENSIELEMLFEHLQGICGSSYEQENVMKKQSRVFFLGNSIRIYGDGNERFKKAAENAKKLDKMLSTLAQTMGVFVISGKEDPVEAMYPQPPMHKCLFPLSTEYTTFHLLSNPSRVQMSLSETENPISLDIILTDGEPIENALKFSDAKSGLEMGRRFLEWGHLCPTAPDTLPLYPAVEDDVFIIKDTLPNLFLIGNQKVFGSMEWNGTKIISVPQFSLTSSAVVITKNFEPRQLQFNLMF